MKVLIVTHMSNASGANKSLLSIIEKLNDKVEFYVLLNEVNKDFEYELKKYGVKILYAKYSWWESQSRHGRIKQIMRFTIDALKYYKNKIYIKKITQKIKKENFDIIYTNTSTVDLGAVLASRLNIPHIWHVREFGKEDFDFKPVVTKRYMVKRFRDASKVIVISKALLKKFKATYSINNLSVIYNGFSIEDLYCPPVAHDLNKRINILVAGQVSIAKGQDQAITAVSQLVAKGYPITLYLAGDIDNSFLKKVIQLNNAKSFVKPLGQVRDMYELRKTMDLELICSRSEAFGRVTIEAMLHSIPVIGANSGGTPELIIDKENGLLFQYGDIDELVDKIETLINNKVLYNQIMNKTAEYGRQFTIDRTANKILKTFISSLD